MACMMKLYLYLSVYFYMTMADPEFCNRGFQLASRFYKCWEQAYHTNKYAPLGQLHDFLDKTFVEAYATHMCSVVKPQALSCLHKEVKPCDNFNKLMDIADKSGGACERNYLNPYFKDHVIEHLVPVESNSQCFTLADNTYQCYKAAGDNVMKMGGQADDIVTFHKVADMFFGAYWDCMVDYYKSNIEVCPHWQIPMLLTVQKTAMPSLFGLRLQQSQVKKLELEDEADVTESANLGPSNLYLLLQLHQHVPDVTGQEEDSVVLELSDLNEEKPKLTLESQENNEPGPKNSALTLKQIKNMLREQRRRNKELRDFITQAQGKGSKKISWKKKNKNSSKNKGAKETKNNKNTAKSSSSEKNKSSQKKLNPDIMVQ